MDGPKSEDEKSKCMETKKIFEEISIDGEINKIYSEKNLGLKKRWKSALDEIFLKEQSAIILEDDTLPSVSFFRFCDDLLEKYVSDKQIAQINGYNYFQKFQFQKIITSLLSLNFGVGQHGKIDGKNITIMTLKASGKQLKILKIFIIASLLIKNLIIFIIFIKMQ